MPSPFEPYQRLWDALRNNIGYQAELTFGKRKSVLDRMSPEQVNLLTPEAKKVLSQIPAVEGQTTEGSGANFTSAPFLPKWLSHGYMTISPRQKNAATGEMFNAPPEFLQRQIEHEAIHGIDYNMGDLSGGLWDKLSPSSKAELMRRMNWGGSSEGSMESGEALAYGGMYGMENTPPEMSALMSKVFLPTTNAPVSNPALQEVQRLDREKPMYNRAASKISKAIAR